MKVDYTTYRYRIYTINKEGILEEARMFHRAGSIEFINYSMAKEFVQKHGNKRYDHVIIRIS